MTPPRAVSVRRLMRRGLRYSVGCERRCRVTARLWISRQQARKHELARQLGRSRRAVTVRAGASRTVVVLVGRRVRRQLHRTDARRLKATVVTLVRTKGGTQRLRHGIVLRG